MADSADKAPLLASGRNGGNYLAAGSSASDFTDNAVNGIPLARASIGVPKETREGEKRVALTPSGVKILVNKGLTVVVEAGAGQAASCTDDEYQKCGAVVTTDIHRVWSCTLVVKINKPQYNVQHQLNETDLLGPQCGLVCQTNPTADTDLQELVKSKKGTLVALNCIPRTSRAQKYDVLSSQSAIAGYRAVVEAATAYPGQFTAAVTAAGKMPPAVVLIIGAGVAGLSAAGTAKGMGASVRAFDTRPAAKEEVETMGATFLTVDVKEDGTGSGGYAKTMSKAFIDAEMALFARQCKEVNIIITTALIPGKKAPCLITEAMVSSMKPGSVVVDLAAEMGGNCELTQPGKVVVHNGVSIVGYTDLLSRVSTQSSTMYSNNVAKFISDLFVKEGALDVPMDDEIVRGSTIIKEGTLMWPPPPPRQFERRPSVTKLEEQNLIHKGTAKVTFADAHPNFSELVRVITLLICGGAFIGMGPFIPPEFAYNFFVFVLAVFVGWKVIWGVTPTLHSPLMSLTNAISGIIAVGGFAYFGPTDKPTSIMAIVAVLVATVNIFGGFYVTQRMLKMFKFESEGPNVVNAKFSNFLHGCAAVILGAAFLIPYHYVRQDSARQTLTSLAYLLCSVLFIMALAHLSSAALAKRGNLLGMVGMFVAFAASYPAIHNPREMYPELLVSLIPGALIGLYIATTVSITSLPELVAGFHSLVGLAAVLISLSSYITDAHELEGARFVIAKVTVYLGVMIGGVTFTGSMVAFGKLKAILPSKPLMLPGRHQITVGLLCVTVVGLVLLIMVEASDMYHSLLILGLLTVLSFYLGVHLIAAIGGGDMPVVISMLNSYSGWACAADGFLLNNQLLIVTGALVGSSGAILSYVMCKGMGRNFMSVIMGGFGEGVKKQAATATTMAGQVTPVSQEEGARLLLAARKIVIVPGYGMAVSKAQHSIAQLTQLLRSHDKEVLFCVHPVAGRMPGHMNVLLAEANIPYEIVKELDEIDDQFQSTDLAVIIGANDTVNPAANDDPSSDLYGMPVCSVWKSENCIVMKRSMAAGYAGVENPLFFKDNTRMLFGDATASCSGLVNNLNALYNNDMV